MGKLADYVVALCEEVLDERAQREKRYPWCLGDVSAKTGRRMALPFDATWPNLSLIVEVNEPQHRGEAVTHWNKPGRLTASGVERPEQRAMYDKRKLAAARENGYRAVVIEWERRPLPEKRDRAADLKTVRRALANAGVAGVVTERGTDLSGSNCT